MDDTHSQQQPGITGDGSTGFVRRHALDGPPTLERDAMQGLERDEFSLLYQPRLDPRTEEVRGVEALLRWRDAYRGQMQPDLFLPPLVQTEVMSRLGQFVLTQACMQAARWERRRPAGHRPIVVAVNVSIAELMRDGFVDYVAAAVEAGGVEPPLLQFEVDSRAAADAPSTLVDRLAGLQALGVSVALDAVAPTVGTDGFLPCRAVNLARRWVRSVDTDARVADQVAALVTRAHAHRLLVGAVGVEKPSQAEALVAAGCDIVQGFLYSEPVPAAELGWQQSQPQPGGPRPAPTTDPVARTASGQLPRRRRPPKSDT